MIKMHFHTNEPREVLRYFRNLGEIYDTVVEDIYRLPRVIKG